MFKKIIAMTLVSIMGIMLFSGCSKLVEEDKDVVEVSAWITGLSSYPNRVTPTYDEPGATFEISVDRGNFFTGGFSPLFQKATLCREATIYWTPDDDDELIDLAYIDVIVKVENNIIGYAVIKITNPEDSFQTYKVEIIKSVIFPKIDGKYQKVTQKQVERKIKAAKK